MIEFAPEKDRASERETIFFESLIMSQIVGWQLHFPLLLPGELQVKVKVQVQVFCRR